MEEEKQNQKKLLKLKVTPFTTIEKVYQKLKSTSLITEFRVHVSYLEEIATIFIAINEVLRDHQPLKKLEVFFDEVKDIQLEHTIYSLQDLKQLTEVSIKFIGNISQKQNQSMGHYLSQFHCLTTLRLEIDCYYVDSKIELVELYQSGKSLSTIAFHLSNIAEGSNILTSLMQDLRKVYSLESLSVITSTCSIRAFVLLDILQQELYGNRTVKELNLNFGVKLIKSDFACLGNLLRALPQLDKLSFYFEESKNSQNKYEIGIYDAILQLKNLKELSIKINWKFQMIFTKLIKSIVQMEHLMSVKLDIHLDKIQQVNNDLIAFGQSLSKIQNLVKLNLDFSYYFQVSIYEAFKFLLLFKSNQHLKELFLDFTCEQTALSCQKQEISLSDLTDLVGRLEEFQLKINLNKRFNDSQFMNDILASIEHSSNLKNIKVIIYFSYNQQPLNQKIRIEDIFKNKINLKSIDLNFQQFIQLEENNVLDMLDQLLNNSSLTNLSFNFNNDFQFRSIVLCRLSETLIKFEELLHLDLSFGDNNVLSDDGIQMFASTFSRLKLLESFQLKLPMNNLSLSTLNILIMNLENLKKTTLLRLTITQLQFPNEEDEKRFGDSFKLPPKLIELELSFHIDEVKYRNIKNMFKNISTLKQIEDLYFYFQTQLQFDESIEISHLLSKLKNLKTLVFLSYSLSQLYIISLIHSLPKLKYIQFYYRGSQNLIITNKHYVKKRESFQVANFMEYTTLDFSQDEIFGDNSLEKENANVIIPSLFAKLFFLNEFKFVLHEYLQNNFCSLFLKSISLLSNLHCLKIDIQPNNQIGSQGLIEFGNSLIKLQHLRRLFLKLDFTENNIIHSECQAFYYNLSNLVELEYFEVTFIFQEDAQGFDDTPEQREALVQLFQSLSCMKKLTNLQIILVNQLIEEQIFTSFYQACSSLKNNLRQLVLFFGTSSIKSEGILQQALQQLNNLFSLELNIQQKVVLKSKRLIHYKLLDQYYSSYHSF